MFNIIVTIFSSMLTITSCNTLLVDDNREKRSLSENLVVGMDYLGKPRIVCHCYGEEMQNLISKNMAMNRRSFIVKVNVDSTKNSGIREKRTVVNNAELIYAPVCCKINLSNKKSFYSYPFSVNLVALNYTDDLKDGHSEASQELSTILVAGLKTVLAKEKSVVSIGVDKFSNISGSVLANIYLTIHGMITQSIVDTLKATISSGNLGGIEVRIVPEIQTKSSSLMSSSTSLSPTSTFIVVSTSAIVPIFCPAICVDTTLCQPSCPANCCAPSVSVCQQPSCPTACAPGCTDACCSIGQRRVRQKY
ncbi:uncharacterized protein LOC124438054 isoform X2 [Xenia sp. Carnegie-2017]|uniref:uncharacterized protein LOC124438054 isoform X2 n=1 Tax=Xenia sp. Carnegie-2017 TaxID=2897299 RepID=UPI001F0395BA|nr:uncharacterized protein LOC124438054 isoform X2 [Xenia sp. Carnegie-2017]